MSGAEAALRAARLGDEVVHGFGLLGMVAGALIGAAIAAAIVAAGVATGGLALVAIIGGCIAGGGLAGGALARGISTAANLPGPTTGVLALAGPTRVTVNGRAALRAGVDFASSCNGLPFNHLYKPGPVLIAQGSRTVTINGRPMARLEMQLECGAKIKTGSDNVTVGGPTATVVEIHDNEHMVETALQVLGFVALGAAGLGAWAAGALAFGGFAAITAGSFVGMNALHDWGESLGPGYGDIMVGVAGFALLGLGAKAAKTPAGEGAIDVLNRTEVTTEGLGSNLGNVKVGLRPVDPEGIAPKTGESEYKATFGSSTSNDYKATFFEENPELKGDVVVHHAVEQQVLNRYPGVVSESEMHSIENLRGIPKEVNSEVHLSEIRKEWNQFYRENQMPTQQQLLEKATEIDMKYGSKFNPPVGQ